MYYLIFISQIILFYIFVCSTAEHFKIENGWVNVMISIQDKHVTI